jgi:hypothetical protein
MTAEHGFDKERDIFTAGAKASDPLVKAHQAFLLARASQADPVAANVALRNALDQVISTQDPLVFDDLGARLALHRSPQNGSVEYWFLGKSYALQADVDFGAAVYLLPCGLGLRCDGSEPRAELRCATGAGCEGGRFGEVRALLANRPGAYDSAMVLYSQMVEAVRSRDGSAFMPR